MTENFQQSLLMELKLLLLPFAVADESDVIGQLLFDVTGWELAAGTQNSLGAFRQLYEQLDDLIEHPPQTLTDVLQALNTVDQLYAAARQVSAQPATVAEGAGKDLISALVIGYLKTWHPALHDLLVLLTVIHSPTEIAPKQISELVKDPLKVLRAEYLQSGGLISAQDADAFTDKLFPRVAALLGDFDYGSEYIGKSTSGLNFGEADSQVGSRILKTFLQPNFETENRYGVALAISPKALGDLGLVMLPFGEVVPEWDVPVDLTTVSAGFAVGPNGLKIFGSSGANNVNAGPSLVELPGYVIGSTDGTRLEVGQFHISGDVSLTRSDVEFGILLALDPAALVISAGDGDGFLQAILPSDGLRVDFDLAIGWSNKRGFYFRGGAGLDVVLPLQVTLLGVVTINSIHLAIKVDDSNIRMAAAGSVSTHIGPIQAVVDQVGLEATFTFPEKNGNLGIADCDLHFKSPTGVGLAIDAPSVVGGGFLQFDPQQGQYSGFLELKIAERISVKGFGLLNTRLPGGGKGFSLVILIFVEGFKPIPLGLGFNLAGIGGLLALNRTFDETALRAGLKQHTLDSILFPQDPIRNAPQIISNLNRVFPPATGHHLFGPMVQITWGTPALITAEVAVVLELGARRRLLLLAQVLSVLPRPEHDLVRLQMDAVGVVDFDQGTAALDASLYDSRLLQKFPLTGDMAMRLSWESSPNFALAVGGLHPAFNPPPNFPKLERIAINLSSGDNPRLRCEAYFAITSNTVQFGARAELFASAAGFSVHGDIGYDVLIQFDPFYFIADFHAQLQLKRGSTNLFKVELKGSLEGPRPLHLKGKATFSIFWWDISIRIDKTLISGEKPPLPAPIEVLPRLQEALGQPGNWTAKLPDGTRALVQLRANAGAASDIRLHPLGTLTVKQGVVPLNMDISRFGQAPPAGPRRFTITSVNLGGKDQSQTTLPIKDFFAPAQFIELTDDQKLSRPSFETMEAGISFGSDALSITADTSDLLEVKTIEFETWILDSETGEARRSEAEKPQPQKPPLFYQLNHTLLLQQAKFGAAGSSELRRTGKAKYRAATINKYQVTKEGWSLVAADDLTKQPLRKPESYTEAEESLRKLQQQEPAKAAALTIVRLSEVMKPS